MEGGGTTVLLPSWLVTIWWTFLPGEFRTSDAGLAHKTTAVKPRVLTMTMLRVTSWILVVKEISMTFLNIECKMVIDNGSSQFIIVKVLL